MNVKPIAGNAHRTFSLKSRDYPIDEYSMREMVVLYCNSDIIVQWKSNAYFPLFLLPHNAIIEIAQSRNDSVHGNLRVETEERFLDFVRRDFLTMRVQYYACGEDEDAIEQSIQAAFLSVLKKKYKITLCHL